MYPKCAALMSTCLCDPRIQLNVFCGWTQRVCGQLTDHFQIARGFNKRCCVPPINVIWRDPFISRCCTCHYALWAAAYSLTYQRKSTYILNISFHNNMYPDIIMPVLARNLWQSHRRSAMKQRRGLWTDTCTECVCDSLPFRYMRHKHTYPMVLPAKHDVRCASATNTPPKHTHKNTDKHMPTYVSIAYPATWWTHWLGTTER